ncbi:kinase-like domain-containing protein, partial [Vararia minispora EC-137]
PPPPPPPPGREPPLPRQNAKIPPPTPPKIIRDKARDQRFRRVAFLGEGGFARVYEVADEKNKRMACKVVTKESLKTKKAKTKLYAEIKIHRSLQHPNIVSFTDCFEDEMNVYMTLELCCNGSLMDVFRRRRRFTEPEARFYLVQIIGACHYMHTHQVIHRDLKLGNLFLDSEMNIKVGDFGLAALIESPGERKKTICGTPNYIAPEVLFDQANGHSFEVDIWSIGVILYTLVVGRPPFQTKEVSQIYERIKNNEYEFPADRQVSSEARELVQSILAQDPRDRPTLHVILDNVFFTRGTVPAYVPNSARDQAPDFSYISRPMSRANLARLRKAALLDEEASISVPGATQPSQQQPSQLSSRSGARSDGAETVSSSRAQQEKEFQKAVLPGSPISVLLSSARQPLIVAPQGAQREEPLLRKLQAVAKDPKSSRGTMAGVHQPEGEDEYEMGRLKELQSQKARIVAQMVPSKHDVRGADDEAENVPPVGVERRPKEEVRIVSGKHEKHDSGRSPTLYKFGLKDADGRAVTSSSGQSQVQQQSGGFEGTRHTLERALSDYMAGRQFQSAVDTEPEPEKLFIVSWVDYCEKYGMGYALTNGAVGVYFRDSTSIILSADKVHFDFISTRKRGSQYQRKSYTISEYPEELKNKVYLLKYFENYIMGHLYGDHSFTSEDLERKTGLEFVTIYLRMKNVIVFRLSNDILQFNFYDHSKLVLSAHGNHITHIDKEKNVTVISLSTLIKCALDTHLLDADEVKFVTRLMEKIRYCKEILHSIY